MNPVIVRQIKTFCAYQERSQKAVRTKLIAIGARGLELENIIVHLIEENYLNELRFAKIFAGSKFRVKKWGRNRIKLELQKQGISSNCIKQGLAEINNTDYHSTLDNLAQKKMDSFKTETKSNQQKLFNHLKSKGYESELVASVVRKYFG